jgi:hypothetical protein
MRKSKLVQQNFRSVRMKNLEFLDYRYGHFLDGNLPLIVGHVLSKFGHFLSKITPEPTQKLNCAHNRTVQKTAQNSLCAGPYGVRMCPENTLRDLFLTRFDLSIKLLDRYT